MGAILVYLLYYINIWVTVFQNQKEEGDTVK